MQPVNQMIVFHVEDGLKIHVLVFVLTKPVLVVQLLVVASMLRFVQLWYQPSGVRIETIFYSLF